jgi:polar amino acid transport system substrate-binding protein
MCPPFNLFERTTLKPLFRLLAATAVAAVLTPLASLSAHADTATLTAAIVPNYPPFEFKDPETAELKGFDVDLGKALAAKVGLQLAWQETSFDQMLNSLATNRVDVILSGMTDLPERHEKADFLDYIKTGPQFFTLTENAKSFPSMDALCGKKVGSSRRTSFPDNIKVWSAANCVAKGKPDIVVVGTDGSADARLQLRQGRIDAAVQGGETLPYQNTLEKNAYAPIGAPFQSQYTALGMRKGNAALNDKLIKGMSGLIADGTYLKLLTKWGLQEHAVSGVMVNGAPVATP